MASSLSPSDRRMASPRSRAAACAVGETPVPGKYAHRAAQAGRPQEILVDERLDSHSVLGFNEP